MNSQDAISPNDMENTVYFVTYRNVLRPDRTLDDYRKGLKHVWPILQEWGATHIEMYQPLYDESGAFYSRYTVSSLDKWNESLRTHRFDEMLKHLADVIDLSQSQVTTNVMIETGLD